MDLANGSGSMIDMCRIVSLICALAALGCQTTSSESKGDDEPGAAQCQEDSECQQLAQDELDRLKRSVTSSRTFEGGKCTSTSLITDTSSVSGPACDCQVTGSGSVLIGPAGAGCYVRGRLGDCLFSDDEFSYCELDETRECTALCAELQERYAADAARTHEGEVKYATCDKSNCHSVLEVDGRCYADSSYQNGRDYDCALSGPQILAQHKQDTSKTETGQVVTDPSWYVPEANGTVSISVSRQFLGTKGSATSFGASLQLYSVSGGGEQRADVIDPLDGADDCGVRRDHNTGTAPEIEFRNVDSAVLIDGDDELPFELLGASNRDFYTYGIDLSDLGVTPRYGGKYGFRASGGSFGDRASVTGIELPEALSMRELEKISHLPRGPLRLTWTGRGSEPLRLRMYIAPQRGDITYTLECLMKDDGEFEIPDAVMQAVPNGIARADFQREKRVLLRDGGKAMLAIGTTTVTHELAYGDRCERPPVVEACERYAENMQKVYSDCDREAPPPDELCPDYITEACTLCPEYFDCISRRTTCTDNQITFQLGCSCPK